MPVKLILAVTGLVAVSYATTFEHPHTPSDKDHRATTGLLTFEKYSARIRKNAPHRFDADRVLATFRKLDTNGDGMLDAPERRAARAARTSALVKAEQPAAADKAGAPGATNATN